MEKKLYYRKLRLVLRGLAEAKCLDKINEEKAGVIKSQFKDINRANTQKMLAGKGNS